MNILWNEDIVLRQFPTLSEDIKTDILVIGGGICGLLCAYQLHKLGRKVVLVEAEKIASKKTLRTTAVATCLQDVYYKDLDEEKAKLFLDANYQAVKEFINLSKEFNFDLEIVDSYKYSEKEDCLKKEKDVIEKFGYKVDLVEKEFNGEIKKALKMSNQVQFHPLKLVNELSKHLQIYEKTKILKIRGTKAYTRYFTIDADEIIVATGYPFLRFKGLYFTKMYQMKSYVMAVKKEDNEKYNAIGDVLGDLYYRTFENYLLVGGNDTITGDLLDGFKSLKNKYSKEVKKYNRWCNQDVMTLDELPYIGKLCLFNSHLYVATGFNMWGMTGSMISSILLSDLIIGIDNEWQDVFLPRRKIPLKKKLKLFKYSFKEIIKNRKHRCTHLGCGLKWNEADKCYECPCHGSKFDEDLNILEGPGQKNVNNKKF